MVERVLMAAALLVLLAASPSTGQGDPPAEVVVAAPPRPLTVGQSGHAAFPGMALGPQGEIRLVWRQGSDHAAARDGALAMAVSPATALPFGDVVPLASGGDHRDPSPSHVRGRWWLTWFTGAAAAPAQGAFAQRQGGAATRIESLPYAAITAPVVALPDGDLGAVYYGRAAGEAVDSAWFARSGDEGATWSSRRIADGRADGRDYNEPWLVVRGGVLHVLHRWGAWDSLGITSSGDGGRTWSPPRRVLPAATGRPTTAVTASGLMVVVYRHAGTLAAMAATSGDGGRTWSAPLEVMAAPPGSPLGMTYGAMVEVLPGVVRLVVGMEQADGSSDLHEAYLVETRSPQLGDEGGQAPPGAGAVAKEQAVGQGHSPTT